MEIIILKEGVHNDTGNINGTEIENSIDPMCSSVTLIKGRKNILIDSGFWGYANEIVDSLGQYQLTPDDIDVLINTHCHLDHCYNNYLFSNAKLIYGRNILSPKRWDVYTSIDIPEITLIETPGHVPDHMSVIVNKDQTYLIAGDALREDIIRNNQKWKSMNNEYALNVRHIINTADVIIPGHGRKIEGEILEELRNIISSRTISHNK
jgi:glyoxylase-like metal-dependent hydrolase (beta-lactamase superfamily II)